MSSGITNDQQMREALGDLPVDAQRKLGARYVSDVIHLSQEPTLLNGIRVAENSARTRNELDSAYKNCKKVSIDRYTACGRDADWGLQAEHFVAAAITACLVPEAQITHNDNIAWKAAMQARMAKNCEMILNGSGEVDNEAHRQYKITMEFLSEP